MALSCLVVTDRERVIARTRVLLGCTAPLDRNAMRRMFHYDASFVDKSEQICFNATRTIDLLETLIRRVPIQAHEIRQEAASILSPRVAESSIGIWTTMVDEPTFRQMGLSSGRVASAWRLRWKPWRQHCCDAQRRRLRGSFSTASSHMLWIMTPALANRLFQPHSRTH